MVGKLVLVTFDVGPFGNASVSQTSVFFKPADFGRRMQQQVALIWKEALTKVLKLEKPRA